MADEPLDTPDPVSGAAGGRRPLRLSVIVPVLDEAALVGAFLEHVHAVAGGAELLVVDGGSTDGTREIAGRWARVLGAPRGRAAQMNAGARAATGDVLWFLHADSRLPADAAARIEAALRDPQVAGGCFRLRIPDPHPLYRVADSLGNLGVDLFGFALGDHGIFVRRRVFEAAGGYPLVPLMEDAEFYRRARRHGAMRQLPAFIETSPRRWERHGRLRTTAVYTLILALYGLRVPLPALAWIYRRVAS